MNNHIIDQFKKLIENYKYVLSSLEDEKEITAAKFRIRQTLKIIDILKQFHEKIVSVDQIKGLPGIGIGTINRVEEILTNGKLAEIKNVKTTPVDELSSVMGIGLEKAKKIIREHGIKSIKELKVAVKDKKIVLPHDILIGLKYHNLLKRNIPRSEMNTYNYIFQGIAKKFKLEAHVCGSYRRGKSSSGDIDVLLLHPHIIKKRELIDCPVNYITLFIKALKKIIIENITSTEVIFDYMGICKIDDKPHRRIDIKMLPYESKYSGLLYFTGPDKLNTFMRERAKKMGYLLNQYGLFDRETKKMKHVKSEKDIFKLLGMDYMTPEQREIQGMTISSM